jgi:hypothetical protein
VMGFAANVPPAAVTRSIPNRAGHAEATVLAVATGVSMKTCAVDRRPFASFASATRSNQPVISARSLNPAATTSEPTSQTVTSTSAVPIDSAAGSGGAPKARPAPTAADDR